MVWNTNLLGGSHLLRALGFNVDGFFDQLQQFQGNPAFMQGLRDSFMMAAGSFGANALANLLQTGGIPGQGAMIPPSAYTGSPAAGMYAPPQNFDFGARPGQGFFEGIMNRQQGRRFERMLGNDPFARQQVEMMLGGHIIPDGRNDGRLTVLPFPARLRAGRRTALAGDQPGAAVPRSVRAGGGGAWACPRSWRSPR